MKFKTGQKVKVIASTYYLNEHTQAMIGKVCEVMNCRNDNTYRVWNESKSDWWHFYETDLRPVEKNWDTLEAGDVLLKENGRELVVQGVIGEVVLLIGDTGDKDNEYSYSASKLELQRCGCTIKGATPEPETIEINGKKYKKDEVTERLSELEPIE